MEFSIIYLYNVDKRSNISIKFWFVHTVYNIKRISYGMIIENCSLFGNFNKHVFISLFLTDYNHETLK